MTASTEPAQPCCDYRDHNSPCGCDCPEHEQSAQHQNGWFASPKDFADPSSHWGELSRRVRDAEEQILDRADKTTALKPLPPEPLTFDEFTQLNRSRAGRWHPGFPDDDTWNLADWSNAMCGEAGEAANVVKKLRRLETGARGVLDGTEPILRADLADEIADVFCYLDLLAQKAGVDLPAAIRKKFNEVSDRQGFPEQIRPVR